MYVLKNLHRLQELPPQLQERIFEKIFRVAEIAKLNKQETAEYEENLKRYRDLYSAIETAKMEGELKGKIERKIEGKIETAKKAIEMGMSIDDTIELTGLSEEQVKELIK
jgi:predicted transposase/invertase (TIGR01784 family)